MTTRPTPAQTDLLAALAASEARLRGVLDAGFDAVVVAEAERDADGAITAFRILDANRRAGALVGRAPAELVGASLLEVFPRSRDWQLWEQCCRVVITGEPVESTQHTPSDEQPQRWLQRQVVPVSPDVVAISSRDVSERQRERLLLEASEARHRELFEGNGAIQLLADAATAAIVDANPAAEAFYGWPRAILRTMSMMDLESIAPEHWRALTASIPADCGLRAQREHRLASGERRQVEASMGVAQIGERRVLHIIVQDLTDRLRAERQLRESEARFRAVLAGMREGVVLHDETGAIRLANPAAERLLGLTSADLLGLRPGDREWLAVHEDGRAWPAAEHPALEALRTGLSQPTQLLGLPRQDAPGELTWLSVSADPLVRAGETRPFAVLVVFADVTGSRASEERLRQAQKLEVVGQLAGGIAHDFNNLLTVIRGATTFLRDGVGARSALLDDIGAIERAVDRASELTRRLLAVGRRQLLHAAPVDLNVLLEEQLPAIRDALPANIGVRLALAPQEVPIAIDRTRLLDAVRALVDNARDAMRGGGALTLSTDRVERVHPHGGIDDAFARPFAVLSVRDTGVGMDEAVRRRLFEPFFSTQPFAEGRGMGLAAVHGLVHQSRGFIECESAPGAGTVIRLHFPLGMPTAVNAPADAPVDDVAPLGAPASGTILLVDDDPMLRELGRRMLLKAGDTVHVAASGEAALAWLATHAADVSALVTDITMPGMSGLDLIDAVRARYPHVPTAAISGYVVNPDARARLDRLGVPFLGKPFAVGDLERLVNTVRRREPPPER
ncbi:MAG: PAS domain S-box protein [Gemmatimonadetes bacterium]|nr:PAS domain S-box protein [Gemmatimonadota bacterium]